MLNLSYRDFSPGYFAPQALTISESSTVRNEKGFLLGMELFVTPTVSLQGYADVYRFPAARYNIDIPTGGIDMQGQLNIAFSAQDQFYIRYKNESKDDFRSEDYGSGFYRKKTQRFRVHNALEASEKIMLRSRIESTLYAEDQSDHSLGIMAYQDVRFSPSYTLSFTGRLAYFDTDDFQSAIYAYENDVLYSFSVPAYSSKGVRYYLMMKWQLFKNTDLWLRYARFAYSDTENTKTNDTTLTTQLLLTF
jgi:hypothetical protein